MVNGQIGVQNPAGGKAVGAVIGQGQNQLRHLAENQRQLGAEAVSEVFVGLVLKAQHQGADALFVLAGAAQLPLGRAGNAVVGLAAVGRVGTKPGQADRNAAAQAGSRAELTVGTDPEQLVATGRLKAHQLTAVKGDAGGAQPRAHLQHRQSAARMVGKEAVAVGQGEKVVFVYQVLQLFCAVAHNTSGY